MRQRNPKWQEQEPGGVVTWRPVEPPRPVEGPLALDLFDNSTLVLELAPDQLAFREQDGRLQQVFFDGMHQLRVGNGADMAPPSSRLFFLRADVPMTWRWRGETSLRVDTGHRAGVLVPLRGACSLLIADPVEFHRHILQGLESLDSDHLVRVLDTLVRTQIESRLAPLAERGALDPVRVQILLDDLVAADLNEDLYDLGVRCVHLAAYAPTVEDEPVAELPALSTPSGSYDDVL